MPDEEKVNVGLQLKRRRQRLKLSLTDVELATKIRNKYLVALESGDADALPNDVYSRGFVQHYAEYLGLNGQDLAERYVHERGGMPVAPTGAPKLDRPRRLVATPTLAVVGGLILIVIVVVVYLGYQFSALAAPPRLSLDAPVQGQTATSATITVKGSATPGSDVAVDDVPVATDTNGGFSTTLVLQDGVNNIRVSAVSKLGKQTEITRSILAKLPDEASAAGEVPGKTFNGVAVAVRVAGSATQITVVANGGQVFKGIMLSGEQKVFTATDDIKITTSNAGATSVTVTNQNVARKVLSPLGNNGEVRTNQDFAKDSGFGVTPTPVPSVKLTPTPTPTLPE